MMSADILLGSLILQKYAQLNSILQDLIHACDMGPCDERDIILEKINLQTNHTGIHQSEEELAMIFLGRPTVHKPND
jgi:hypothetical protein